MDTYATVTKQEKLLTIAVIGKTCSIIPDGLKALVWQFLRNSTELVFLSMEAVAHEIGDGHVHVLDEPDGFHVFPMLHGDSYYLPDKVVLGTTALSIEDRRVALDCLRKTRREVYLDFACAGLSVTVCQDGFRVTAPKWDVLGEPCKFWYEYDEKKELSIVWRSASEETFVLLERVGTKTRISPGCMVASINQGWAAASVYDGVCVVDIEQGSLASWTDSRIHPVIATVMEFLAVGVSARVDVYSCLNIHAPELVAQVQVSDVDGEITDMATCASGLAVTALCNDGLSAITLLDLQGSSNTGFHLVRVGFVYQDQLVEAVPAGPGLLATMGDFDGASFSLWSFADGSDSPSCVFSDTDCGAVLATKERSIQLETLFRGVANFNQSSQAQSIIQDQAEAELQNSTASAFQSAASESEEQAATVKVSDEEATRQEAADVARAILSSKIDSRSADGVVILRLTSRNREIANALLHAEALAECRSKVEDCGCNVMPDWANGALLLVPLTQEQVDEAQLDLRAHNIVALESDKDAITQALLTLPNRRRPQLKPEHFADRSMQERQEILEQGHAGSPSSSFDIFDELGIKVERTFLQGFAPNFDIEESSDVVCTAPCGGADRAEPKNPRCWGKHQGPSS